MAKFKILALSSRCDCLAPVNDVLILTLSSNDRVFQAVTAFLRQHFLARFYAHCFVLGLSIDEQTGNCFFSKFIQRLLLLALGEVARTILAPVTEPNFAKPLLKRLIRTTEG